MRKVSVTDPFGVTADPAMPQLALALNRKQIGPLLKRGLRKLFQEEGQVLRLVAIKVLRHKLGKRCVIQYDVFLDPPGDESQTFSILGKVRAHRPGRASLNLQESFWRACFDDASADGISVPEPVGLIEELQMWFQRKIPGALATSLIVPGSNLFFSKRVAECAAKIHRAGVPTAKVHTVSDELRILKKCFAALTQRQPDLARRLDALYLRCERVSATLPERAAVGIHRDFYSDQILFQGERAYVLDFDLYCRGDPALDIGNFIGHLTEQALRLHGNPDALRNAERAIEDRFLELSGRQDQKAIAVYTNLTLARHIFLSAQFPDRSHLTEPLLALCESRFSK